MKYDVFISYSRKDYVDEHEVVKVDSPVKAILDFLDAHQISYWFDKDGIYSGSEFVEVIVNAIADSKMMLFVSSEHSNESIYTAGEIFEAIENNQLIIPIKIDGSKYNKKFKILLNPLDYIDITKADAFSDLLKAIDVEKTRIAKIEQDEALRREELKKREWRKSVKLEIQEQANELLKLKETRNALLESIYKKLRSIDQTKKQCPVCESKVDIEVDYCPACGWFFPSLSEIEGMDVEVDKSVLILAQSRWEKKGNIGTKFSEDTVDSLQKEIKTLEERKAKLTDKVKTLELELMNSSVKRKLTPKLVHVIYISLILLVMGVGTFAYKVESKSASSFYDSYLEYYGLYCDAEDSLKEANNNLIEANSIISAISDNMPFIVTEVEVKNGSDEWGDPINSKESTYISTRFKYIGLKEASYKIDFKLFRNNQLSRIDDISPKRYTYSENCSFDITNNGSSSVVSWRGEKIGYWPSGNYRIEIWWHNKKLAEKEFVVK